MRIETERLILRDWRDDDLDPLARILGDPQSRPFHPNVYTRAETRELLDRCKQQRDNGFLFRAAELKSGNRLVGLIGLAPIHESMRTAIPGEPAHEIGWQLDKSIWGQGLAPEGARAWLDFAWNRLQLPEVVAFTYEGNHPSQRVMEKIGMERVPDGDFMHPKLEAGHRMRPHILYRIENPLL